MDIPELLESAAATKTFSAGHTLFVQGEPGATMYIVLEGRVDIRVDGIYIDQAGPGDIVGEMGLIDAKARSATASVLEDCRLAVVDEKQFLLMVRQTPHFALRVMRVLAERLRRMNTIL